MQLALRRHSTARESEEVVAARPVEAPHARSAQDVLARLESRARGLEPAEARARLERFGPNALPQPKTVPVWRVFVRQFANPLIYVLLLASVVSLVMGELTDAGFIFAVLLLNAVIGAVQEQRAEKSASALRSLIVQRAIVVRGGEEYEIQAEELVPGDVVLLEAGNRVPADGRLLWSNGLLVDESLLTGESMAVGKDANLVVSEDAALGDRKTMAHAGTMVLRGRAHMTVVGTGSHTELGRIAGSVLTAESAKAPLIVRMESFTRKIAIAVVGTVALLAVISILRGSSLYEVAFIAVALAVSAIPEGLPVALTIALGVAVRRMSRRNVIARRLVAVEALGSCTFIASDKTGTLTMNSLSARSVVVPRVAPMEVTFDGPPPMGTILAPSNLAVTCTQPVVQRLSVAAALCNDGFAGHRDGSWTQHGDAVDVALLVMALKAGVRKAELESAYPRLDAIPFEPERRYAASLHEFPDGPRIFLKGAVERLLPMCSKMATIDGEVPICPEEVDAQARALAAAGYRVLALADGRLPPGADPTLQAQPLEGLVLVGLVGLIDPLRPEAKEAVRACQQAGVQVAMVTGDHPITALAIARELGLASEEREVVTGPQLAEATRQGPQAVDALVRNGRVFARVEPQQKLEIVEALIRLGHFVAVTGDGANDAPALKAAHIGVAMGKSGTDVARETSKLILADDNFASIVAGIEEGRIAYSNVRKVIFLLISCGAAELLLFLLTTGFGLPPPLFASQLLWLNLVTNGIQHIGLSFEPAEGGELRRKPRSPKEPVFNGLMITRTLWSALVMAVIGFGQWWWMLEGGMSESAARNILLLQFVLFENVQAFNARSETRFAFAVNPLGNRVLLLGVLGAQLIHIAAMYTPGLRDILAIAPVSIETWLVCLAFALTLVVVLELHKVFRRWREERQPRGAAPQPAS